MDTLPQELVDQIIDQLADQGESPSGGRPTNISQYSTVSRLWVIPTQKQHFECVHFEGDRGLKKWRTKVKPDPSGVSHHIRKLSWGGVKDLEEFDSHIRAFTHVEAARLFRCSILSWLGAADAFASMGSSLVKLEIEESNAKYHIITSVLAALPHLRHLRARSLEVDKRGEEASEATKDPPRIPFFEDAKCFDLLLMDWTLREPLDWVPPSARVRDLRIDAICVLEESGPLNKWITSSARCLEFLTIISFKENVAYLNPGPNFSPLNLSRCTALESLHFKFPLPQPGIVPAMVLPSLYSSPPPKIVLELVQRYLSQVDFRAWETLGVHLHRLAKRFETTHPGRKMEVEVFGGSCQGKNKLTLVEWFKSGETMLKLKEHANVVVTE